MIFPLLVAISMFAVYIHNLSHSVYGGDVGDLVTAAYVAGVPHPPGYPLFTLLGFILSHTFYFFTPAFAVGLISAASGAGALFFFYLTVHKLSRNHLISFVSTAVLATSYLFWFYNEIAEVFAFNNFFAMVLLYLSISLYQKFQRKLFFIFWLVVGLAGTNHQTIVLLLPGFLLLIGTSWIRSRKKEWKLLVQEALFAVLCCLIGFLPYVYVPIAASHNPPINWDNVHDLRSFFHLLLRQDYGTFSGGIFLSPTLLQRFIIVKAYALTLLSQLTIPVVFISFLGIISLLRKEKLLVIAIVLSFLLSGPLFVFYVGFPLAGSFYVGIFERFFVLSSIIFLFFFPFGLQWVSILFSKFLKRDLWKVAVPVLFLLVPLQLFFYNFPKTNLSNVNLGDTFGKDLLEPLPKNAALFLGGDTTLFNGWYVHYGLHERPDVSVLNLNGLARDAYFDQLKIEYKKAHPKSKPEEIAAGILHDLNRKRPVFAIDAIQPSEGEKFRWLPYGLSYKLLRDDEDIPSEADYIKMLNTIWGEMHTPYLAETQGKAYGSLTISDLPEGYANAMLSVGNFFITDYHDEQKAKEWYDKALLVSNRYPKIYSVEGVWYLTISHECSIAAKEFSSAIDLDPTERLNYYLLYTTYTSCLHDKKQASRVSDTYAKLFHTDFKKAYNEYMKGQITP